MLTIILCAGAALGAAILGYAIRKYIAEKKIQNAEAKAQHILEQALAPGRAADAVRWGRVRREGGA